MTKHALEIRSKPSGSDVKTRESCFHFLHIYYEQLCRWSATALMELTDPPFLLSVLC